jgi:hypothetical protein
MLAKAGIQKSLKFLDSGSRFLQRRIQLEAEAIASLPGKTLKLCNGFRKRHTSVVYPKFVE